MNKRGNHDRTQRRPGEVFKASPLLTENSWRVTDLGERKKPSGQRKGDTAKTERKGAGTS